MARRVSRSFFAAKEVLFIGYSKRNEAFCRAVREAFERSGAKTYPVNPRGDFGDLRVYASMDEVPARPELAYVLTNKATTAGLVEALAAKGVVRAIFQSSMAVDGPTLDRCAKLGIETAVACPMMALGGGFHRFHGFLAGVGA
jgi:acyl-CoA synthetase (NDP forming)